MISLSDMHHLDQLIAMNASLNLRTVKTETA